MAISIDVPDRRRLTGKRPSVDGCGRMPIAQASFEDGRIAVGYVVDLFAYKFHERAVTSRIHDEHGTHDTSSGLGLRSMRAQTLQGRTHGGQMYASRAPKLDCRDSC